MIREARMSNSNNKNIIICADGTGNKGGYTPDSNVYKTYNGVELHNVAQISFYDNGVGISTNKIWRGLSGALGFGFQRNVRELYRFLAMNYEDGDHIYLFGFSRGAATIRAFLGFISTCGLVKGKGLSHEKLKEYTEDAFEAYKQSKRNDQKAKDFRQHKNSHGIVPVQFVGVWDTVSALGLPERTDKLGLISRILSLFFQLADHILNIIWPHHFYKYQLSGNVKHACQALALDDARTSFWPMVWDENAHPDVSVEQVWFAGMHANVGGGYRRQGLSNVALHWMLLRAEECGLEFKPGFISKQTEDANVNGRLHDSRDGVAIFYRYHPREIAKLCESKLRGKIRIHETVLQRMKLKTANYAPTHLPDEFNVVGSDIGSQGTEYNFSENKDWVNAARAVSKFVTKRKLNYMVMLLLAISFAIVAAYTWTQQIDYMDRSGLAGYIADLVDYITPSMLENLVELSIMGYPLYTIGILVCVWLFWKYNQSLRAKTLESSIVMRNIVNAKQY